MQANYFLAVFLIVAFLDTSFFGASLSPVARSTTLNAVWLKSFFVGVFFIRQIYLIAIQKIINFIKRHKLQQVPRHQTVYMVSQQQEQTRKGDIVQHPTKLVFVKGPTSLALQGKSRQTNNSSSRVVCSSVRPCTLLPPTRWQAVPQC